jgi:hypothetical protein
VLSGARLNAWISYQRDREAAPVRFELAWAVIHLGSPGFTGAHRRRQRL